MNGDKLGATVLPSILNLSVGGRNPWQRTPFSIEVARALSLIKVHINGSGGGKYLEKRSRF